MKTLKQLFPRSFAADSFKGALVAILFYVILNIIGGFILGLFDGLPVLGFAFNVFKALLLIYVFAGISLAVLKYLDILKS